MRSATVALVVLLALALGAGASLCLGYTGDCSGRAFHEVFITTPDAQPAVVLAAAPRAPDGAASYDSVVLDPIAPPPRA